MKYGKSASREMSADLKTAAKSEGLLINYKQINKIPNTFITHLLIKEAQKTKKAEKLYLMLFNLFFERGEDIGNISILEKAIRQLELNINLKSLLENKTKREELRSEENNFRNKGIAAVPAYILNDRKLIEGAQSSSFFEEAFNVI